MSTAPSDPSRESIHEAYDRPGARRFSARDGMVCVFLAALFLAVLQGPEIRRAGERMEPGIQKTMVLAVGHPAGWLGDRTGIANITNDATGWLSPDDDLSDTAGFADAPTLAGSGKLPPVTPDAFDPVELGAKPAAHRPLKTILVTGDSMATPLDTQIGQKLSGREGVEVVREPHLGTGISKSLLVDWGKLSVQQVSRQKPEAVVVFIGANEGFPMPGPDDEDVKCCGPDYAAVFANRVRRMMDTYRQKGAARVYWLTLPAPRDKDQAEVARTVNAAIEVAAQPMRTHVRVWDSVPVFTPGGRYRDAMDGKIVRQADGIHLNDAGARIAADQIIRLIDRDFG